MTTIHDRAALDPAQDPAIDRRSRAFLAENVGMVAEAERDAEADTGLDADTWAARDRGVQEALRRHGGPALRRVGDYPYDLPRIFDAGLRVLLDGIAVPSE